MVTSSLDHTRQQTTALPISNPTQHPVMAEEPAARPLYAHALLLPIPFQGHITPFMELGNRLAALGVRVTLVTTHRLHAKILRSQEALPHPIATRHAHFTLVGLADGLPDRTHSSLELLRAIENLEDPVVELVHTLAAQGSPVTCIIADFFLCWSPSLACRTSLPEFIFWPQCTSMLAMYLHVDALIAAGYNPFPRNDEEAMEGLDSMDKVQCIPSIAHLDIRYADLPFQGPQWRRGVDWHEGLIRHRLKHLPKAQGVLVNSFEGLEGEVGRALTAELQHRFTDRPLSSASLLRLIGPVSASSHEGTGTSLWEEEVEECMQWLDEQPIGSVIFVAFGSLATLSCKEQIQEVARGLVASGQRFLWVLRKDAIEPINGEEAMKIEDALPYGFLEKIEGKGKVVHWAPQVRVLSHPSVGGFFSHCGWNSTLESINAGIPILGWPSFVDQFPNCRLISHVWGVGLELQRNFCNETTKENIVNGICELMQGPHAQGMHARAIALKNLSREASLFSRELLALVDDILNLN